MRGATTPAVARFASRAVAGITRLAAGPSCTVSETGVSTTFRGIGATGREIVVKKWLPYALRQTIVPHTLAHTLDQQKSFGDLYEIKSAPYEIFVNGANANDVVVITALTPVQLQIR